MSSSTPTPFASSPSASTQPTTAPSTHNGEETEIINGDHAEDAESSKMAEQHQEQSQSNFAHQFTDYVFNVGYLQQRWADVQLTFFNDALKLHRVILARSPFLAQYMGNAAPGTTIPLQFRDDQITAEAVHTCIHHLYNPAFHLVTALNARAVLATSLQFGGIPELVHHAYTVARDSISADTLSDWIGWISATSVSPISNGYGYSDAPPVGSGNGEEAWEDLAGGEGGWYGRYGEYSDRLKQDILDYLTITLPSSPPPASESTPPTPLAHLLPYYTPLPFPLFKRVVESPVLPFKDKQAQFTFAKKAIAARKKRAAGGQAMEEAAVLAFKSGEGGAVVEITRKSRKGRPALWKVEG
ncbi:uncharacterized protein MKK02DRAFT_40752 [Dioszegia hungarica]|uniref:BTB domain-containing protein n=1 Tax=Dioszegia hungarica TaxID=4972 RepID=A0AA38H4E6_9TREE|nr:uncharacterized protein MKK02DRAFT_40752 [Dioszegia hungarica]KAI9632449.1 hypothetical protein MKK02DRAFT_40752 [Dioszegia hungarica]